MLRGGLRDRVATLSLRISGYAADMDLGPESNWSPEGFEELLVRILFELNARTIEIQAEIQGIRRLLEDDEDEDEEDGLDGEAGD